MFIKYCKKYFGGGGGNWTRIQELRPVDSTRLVRLLEFHLPEVSKLTKPSGKLTWLTIRKRSQVENAS